MALTALTKAKGQAEKLSYVQGRAVGQPEAYDPHLDVDFSPLRGDDPGTDGCGQAA